MDTFNRAVDSARNAFSGDKTTQSGTEPVSGQTGAGSADEPYDAGNTAGHSGSTGEGLTSSGSNLTGQSGNLGNSFSNTTGDGTGTQYGSGLPNATESVHYDDKVGGFVTSSGAVSGQSTTTDSTQYESNTGASGGEYGTGAQSSLGTQSGTGDQYSSGYSGGMNQSSTTGNLQTDDKIGASRAGYGSDFQSSSGAPPGTTDQYRSEDQSNSGMKKSSTAGNLQDDSKISATSGEYGTEAQSKTTTDKSRYMSDVHSNTTGDATGANTDTTGASGPPDSAEPPSETSQSTRAQNTNRPYTEPQSTTDDSKGKNNDVVAGGESEEAKEHRAKGETWTGAHWIKFPGTGEGAELDRRMEKEDSGDRPGEAGEAGALDPGAADTTKSEHGGGMLGKVEGKLHMGGHHNA
ncbi:hypothetical protein MMC13_003525 [Lambiella insularis]|nr:hypothetical protein [Lambiella insularis]